jgi:hypothetical protein
MSTEETVKDGTTRLFLAFGPHGKGFLMYQRDGYMCAVLANPDLLKSTDPAHATPEEKVTAAEGNFFYCGWYEIDVKLREDYSSAGSCQRPQICGIAADPALSLKAATLSSAMLRKTAPPLHAGKLSGKKWHRGVVVEFADLAPSTVDSVPGAAYPCEIMNVCQELRPL